MTTPGRTRRHNRLAWLAGLIVVVAACSSTPAAASAGSSLSPPPASDAASPEPTHDQPSSALVGHYRMDVKNVGGGTHKGTGHHEGDGAVICTHGKDWSAKGVYFPNDPTAPGRDIGDFLISNTPGHEVAEMTLMDHTTDSLNDWSVMASFYSPTFKFTITEQSKPVTVGVVADDYSQHVEITATCSVLEETP